MSHDYLLCKLPADAPREPAFEDVEPRERIGTADEIRLRISRVFPAVAWKERSLPGLGAAVFGRNGPPEFQFSPDAHGAVTSIMMSRAGVDEVRALLRELDCVALDLQAETVVSG